MSTTLRALLLIVCLFPRASDATLLGSWTQSHQVTIAPAVSPLAGVYVCFGPVSEDFGPCEDPAGHPLFESLLFSTADAGSTLVATADTDPDFAGAAQLLTNGVVDNVELGLNNTPLGAGVSQIAPETFLSGTGTDFAGYIIDSIELHLHDNFSVHSDPQLIRWVASGQITLRIFGSPVPEPSAAMLVGIGLALLSRIRRKDT